MIARLMIALLALAGAAAARADTPFEIVATYPHDSKAFTEGLFYQGGLLYESTGLTGQSDIRIVQPKDGKIVRRVAIDPSLFGEGIAPWGKTIVSLTWRAGRGFVWQDKTLKQSRTFTYAGEGWGLTQDGKRLIMSDGTATLRFLDPKTLKQTGTLDVTWNGAPVPQLNELEYVNGEILANIWYSPLIARIDPATGKIRDWINLTALEQKNRGANRDAVLNGIAWDPKARLLYVTGKLWPHLYALRLDP